METKRGDVVSTILETTGLDTGNAMRWTTENKIIFGRLGLDEKIILKWILNKFELKVVDCVYRTLWRLTVITFRSDNKFEKFLEWLSSYGLLKKDWTSWTQLILPFIIIYTGNENYIKQWERNMFQFRHLCVLNNLIWIAAGWSSIRCTILRKSFWIEYLILRSSMLSLRNTNELPFKHNNWRYNRSRRLWLVLLIPHCLGIKKILNRLCLVTFRIQSV
jgi:hypothetical protein